jgi:hypothetical protein
MLLVNITPHLLSRRPRPILRNTRGSRTCKNTTEFCLTLFISQDAIFILICILHLILHWRARTAETFPLFILFIFYFVLYLTLQCYYSAFGIIVITILYDFTPLFVRRGLSPPPPPFMTCCLPDDCWCQQLQLIVVLKKGPMYCIPTVLFVG